MRINFKHYFIFFLLGLLISCSNADKIEKVEILIEENSSNVSLRPFDSAQSLLNKSISSNDDCYDLNFDIGSSNTIFSYFKTSRGLIINEVLFSDSHQTFVEIKQRDQSALASYGKSCLDYSRLILSLEDENSAVLYSTSFDSVSLKPHYITLKFDSSFNYINAKKAVLFWDSNNNNIYDVGELIDTFDFNLDSFSNGKSLELDRFTHLSPSSSIVSGGTPGKVNSYFNKSVADTEFNNADNIDGVVTKNISTNQKSIVYKEAGSNTDCSTVKLVQLWLKPGNINSGGHTYLFQNEAYKEGYHEFSPYSVISIDMTFNGNDVNVSDIKIFNSDFIYNEDLKEAVFEGKVAYSFPVGRNSNGTSSTGCWMQIIFDFDDY